MADLIQLYKDLSPAEQRQLAHQLYKTGIFGSGSGSPISGLPLDHNDAAEITNVGADDHHNEQHAIDGAAHTGTLANDHAQQHAIDSASDHTFPGSGGITWLDDDGNWTDPGAIASFSPIASLIVNPNSTTGVDYAGYSYRQVLPANLLGLDGGHIRLLVTNGITATLKCDHVSIGVQDAAQATVDTPIEITFNGGDHGFTIPVSVSLLASYELRWSDVITFTWTDTNAHVVIFDFAAAGTQKQAYRASLPAGCIKYQQAAASTYDEAAPAGAWTSAASQVHVIYAIEIGP